MSWRKASADVKKLRRLAERTEHEIQDIRSSISAQWDELVNVLRHGKGHGRPIADLRPSIERILRALEEQYDELADVDPAAKSLRTRLRNIRTKISLFATWNELIAQLRLAREASEEYTTSLTTVLRELEELRRKIA